ncbi:hypothetical protein RRG08_057051 [Elysia crispata]|uniref:Uncharacterized protein n=1 Tax=Elysia crispata TaxID=231223 RepID=A0AAE0Z7T6_9GAST|nr:hypothetical protein RRG08_057051 [Elysia crispata]
MQSSGCHSACWSNVMRGSSLVFMGLMSKLFSPLLTYRILVVAKTNGVADAQRSGLDQRTLCSPNLRRSTCIQNNITQTVITLRLKFRAENDLDLQQVQVIPISLYIVPSTNLPLQLCICRLISLPPYLAFSLLSHISLQLVSAYSSCLPTARVSLQLVSPYSSCLPTALDSLQLLSPYSSFLPTARVSLQLVSPYSTCLPTAGVSLQLVSPYSRCLPTARVSLQLLSPYSSCLPTARVSLQHVSPYSRCLPTARVSLQQVSPYSSCLPTALVSLQLVSPYSSCLPTARVSLQHVSPYSRCLPTARVSLQLVSPYSSCLPTALTVFLKHFSDTELHKKRFETATENIQLSALINF